jgi:hypothetical protein
VILAVLAVKVLRNEVANESILPVRLVTVVLPNVDDPTVKRLPNAPVPVTVVDPAIRAVTAPLPAVKLVKVVEAKVEDPETSRF